MPELDELPLSTSAYLADTGHLTTLEHGAYLLLLIAMRRSATGWLPGDDQYLARATRLTVARWKRIATTIRAMLVADGDKVSQKRILRERTDRERKPVPGEDSNRDPKSLENHNRAPNGTTAPPSLLDSVKDSEVKEGSEGAVRVGRGGKYRRGARVRMPDTWAPSERGKLYAASKNFTPERTAQVARACMLYHRKHGTLIADFEATWESWVDREITFAAERAQRTTGQRDGGPSMFEIAAGTHRNGEGR